MSNEAVVKIGLSAREFQQGMRQMQNELRQSMSEFDLASEKAKLFGTTADYLGAQVEKLSAQLEAETAILGEQKAFITQLEGDQVKLAEAQKLVGVSLADLNNERKESLAEYGAESEQVKALDISIASLNKEYIALDRSIAKNNTSLARATTQANRTEMSTLRTEASLNGLNRQLATRHLDSFATGMGRISSGADRVANKLMPLSLGIGAVGAISAYNSIKFEDAMAKVGTIADTSQVPLSGLKKEILNLSNQTGTSASDIAEATYQALSAGQNTKDAVEFVAQANKLATAGFANSADVVKTLAVAMNSYGMSASQVGTVSDKLLKVQNLGITTVKELGQTLAPVIQIASGANVGFTDLTTSMALLTHASGDTALSATQLKGMIAELNKTGSKSSDILEKLTHKSFSDLMKSGMSLGQVIQLLSGYAKKSHTSINNLFGNIRAGGAALAMSKAGLKSYNGMLKQIKDSSGLTNKSFKEMTNTAGFKLKKSFIELQNSAIKLGDALTPVIITISKGLTKIASAIGKLSPAQLKTITEVGLSIIAFTGFMKVLSLVTGGIGTLTKGLSSTVKFFMKSGEGASGASKLLLSFKKTAVGTGKLVAKSAKGIGKAFAVTGKGIAKVSKAIGKEYASTFKSIGKGSVKATKGIGKGFKIMGSSILKGTKALGSGVAKSFSLMKTGILKTTSLISKGAIKSFSLMKTGAIKSVKLLGTGVTKSFKLMGKAIKNSDKIILRSLKGLKDGAIKSVSLMKTGIINSGKLIKTGVTKSFSLMKKGAINSVKLLKDGAIKSFGLMKTGLIKSGSLIKTGVMKTFDLMGKGITKSISLLKTGAIKSFGLLKTGLLGSANLIKTGTLKSFDLIKSGTLKSIGLIKDGALKSFELMKTGILTASSAIGSGFKTMASVIGTGAKSMISGLRAVWAVMLANPITMIIVAIAAIGIALYECYEHCAWFRNKVDWIWKEIKQIFMGFIHFLENVFKGKFTGVIGVLVLPLRLFMQRCVNTWNNIKEIFDGFIDFFTGVFTGNWSQAFQGLKEIFTGVFGNLAGIASSAMNAVLSVVMPIIHSIESAFSGIMSVIHTVSSAASSVGHTVSHALGFHVVLPQNNIQPQHNPQSRFLAMPINTKKPINFSLASQTPTSLNSLNSLTTGLTGASGTLNNISNDINIEAIITGAVDKIITKLESSKNHKEINLKVILNGKEIAYASNDYQNRMNGKEIELQKRMRGIT
ncbi:phage tail tape measure protein [uncultured Clostridium sp.]|uniref:phage tail tape measure protein n=1 Tax=uncultured Clostridium sp. TaxID=59620 RepID=UPI002609445E|nr:phage tail tape measure protein [uncultured Clostridium sp.]